MEKTWWQKLFGIHVCEIDGCEYDADDVNRYIGAQYKRLAENATESLSTGKYIPLDLVGAEPKCPHCGRGASQGCNPKK